MHLTTPKTSVAGTHGQAGHRLPPLGVPFAVTTAARAAQSATGARDDGLLGAPRDYDRAAPQQQQPSIARRMGAKLDAAAILFSEEVTDCPKQSPCSGQITMDGTTTDKVVPV